MKWVLLAVATLLSACAGSPDIMIIKNVYVTDSDDVEVTYRTESTSTSVAEIVQDLKDLIKASPK